MLKEYWNHPIGVGAAITDLNTKRNLEVYNSTHFLSSTFFSENDLKSF